MWFIQGGSINVLMEYRLQACKIDYVCLILVYFCILWQEQEVKEGWLCNWFWQNIYNAVNGSLEAPEAGRFYGCGSGVMNREVNILSDALCPPGMHDFYYKHNQRLLAQINMMFCSKNLFVFFQIQNRLTLRLLSASLKVCSYPKMMPHLHTLWLFWKITLW